MREEVLLDPALRALANLSDYDRSQVEQIIRHLCADTSGAEYVGRLIDDLPLDYLRYNEDQYYVLFDLSDEVTLRVWQVSVGPRRQTS